MRISVIVPIYNVSRPLLGACLDSIAKQTLRADDYEVLLVDDCSTKDETTALATEFAETFQNATLLSHPENRGLNEARRTGTTAANGDYVFFVDGDDILTRDAIENVRLEAVKSSADVVTAPFWRWDPTAQRSSSLPIVAKPLPGDPVQRLQDVLAVRHSFTMCGRLFKRDLVQGDVFEIPKRMLHEDLVSFVRILFRTHKSAHVSRPIYYYTINPGSITRNFSHKHAEDINWALNDWVKQIEQSSDSQLLLQSLPEGAEKLFSLCVKRCVTSDLDIAEKATTLAYIKRAYTQFPVALGLPSTATLDTLLNTNDCSLANDPRGCINRISAAVSEAESESAASRRRFVDAPSEMARRLKDKVVFICQVDYQLRSAAEFARELRRQGHPCVILDNSAFASGGLRQLSSDERAIFYRTEWIKIPKPPYGRDWLSTSKLVVVFNDFNDDFREALEYRYRLGLSAVCVVEGISDFLRVDFKELRYLPYRRCDHVFLAGEDDRKYFNDRGVHVVGLPIIEKLAEKEPVFPSRPLAALNVNFTYGVFEDARDEFVKLARCAFSEAGFDWLITQHPADRANLTSLPVTNKTQYDLIDECTVFVSRFATGILEALASGKPAIYFNPHGEKVEKFKTPLGAFDIATNKEQLVIALRRVLKDIDAGVDFRERALYFLKRHAAYALGPVRSTNRFADAATAIINSETWYAVDTFFDRLEKAEPFNASGRKSIFGDFERCHKAQLNEEEVIARYFGDCDGVMIDVGANFGNSCDVYLGKGWTVHAFEPDPNNRRVLLETWGSNPRLVVNEEAVSDKEGLIVPFYASDESTGISGLSAFTAGHKKITEVQTTTLRDYYRKVGLKHADFLKIDVEGFDKFVLDGFPWEIDLPDVVLAEFEDSKTVPLGYTAHDLAETMQSHGYTVFVSEWHPIIRYGIAHDWRRLIRYSENLDLKENWGNLIGFRQPPHDHQLRSLTRQTLKFARRPALKDESKKRPQSTGAPQPPSIPQPAIIRPFYAPFGDWLMKRSLRTFIAGKLARRTLAGLWRRRVWTAPVLFFIVIVAGLGFLPAFTEVRAFFWAGAAFAALAFGLIYLALRVYQFTNVVSAGNAGLRMQIRNDARRLAAVEKKLAVIRKDMHAEIEAAKAAADNAIDMTKSVNTALQTIERGVTDTADALRKERAADKEELAQMRVKVETEIKTVTTLKKALSTDKDRVARLRERIAAGERQISAMRYPDAPATLVFFGHHKCASRFFRSELFGIVAEATSARVRKYEIKNPPFHYSMSDDLDLCNMHFNGLGDDGRDVVLFSNATAKSLSRIKRATEDWKGLRIVRDPRQVLVSGYFHHKGEHPSDMSKTLGWIWDQLAQDKPILQELSVEDGLLYELNHIAKQIIETQILCPFDDERVMTIKIEDFSENPKMYLSEISKFLGIADIAGIDFSRTNANPESGPWQNHFTSRLRQVFKERYGQALIDLGYAEDFDW